MTDWKALAAAQDPPVSLDAASAAVSSLERLEAALQPMEDALLIDTLPWTAPEELR